MPGEMYHAGYMALDLWTLLDSPWRDRVRRMRRTDPVYKPAMLLVVLDMLDDGTATADFVPVQDALSKFDALLVRAGIARSPRRGVMPAFHLSTSSSTREPFWALLHDGRIAHPDEIRPTTDRFRVLEDLAPDLATAAGRLAARISIYELLEDDGRPECHAILKAHDIDKAEVDGLAARFANIDGHPFSLDDPEARRDRAISSRVVRDRALRLAVLPAYGYSCALCSTRLRWNNLYEAEAAHIKPRSCRGADDVRNALSLCHTHHWAFDNGLWSATDDLKVIVARPNAGRGDDLEAVRRFEGAALHLPEHPAARPHALALEWHRDVRFGRAA